MKCVYHGNKAEIFIDKISVCLLSGGHYVPEGS